MAFPGIGGMGGPAGPGFGPGIENLLGSLLGSTSLSVSSPRFSAQIGDPNRGINDLLKQLLQGRTLNEGRDEVDRPLTTTVQAPQPNIGFGLPDLQGFPQFNPFGTFGQGF